MRPTTVTLGPLAAASANAIAQSQTLAGAGPLTLNGATVANGVSTLDMPRRVAIASAGNDSGLIFTVTGTGRGGAPQSETVSGANGGASSTALDYLTVSSIVASGATAGTVTAGTNSSASSRYFRFDEWAPGTASVGVETTGVVAFVVEQSWDDPNSPTNPVPASMMTWFPAESATSGGPVILTAVPLFLRVTLTSGAGLVRAIIVQYGASNLNIGIVKD